MNIKYLSTSYIPYRRADSVHVMHMCESLSKAGHEVTLVYKKSPKFTEKVVDAYQFYGVDPNFKLKGVSRPPFKGGGLLYSWGMKQYLSKQSKATDLIFSRDISGALYAIKYELPLIFEIHVIPDSQNHLETIKKVLCYDKLIAMVILTNGLLKDFKKEFSKELKGQKLIVAHDAFTPRGKQKLSFLRANKEEKLKIGYAGNLYAGKGMEVIGELAGKLPHFEFNIAGGEPDDIKHWKAHFPYPNLTFLGFMPPGQLDDFYSQQDILLLPPLKKSLGRSGNNIAAWMSPMKLFEYMHAGKPIIASSLEVLKEVLVEGKTALLADPDRPDDWVKHINRLASDNHFSAKMAENAYKALLNKYTWQKRVEHILTESNL